MGVKITLTGTRTGKIRKTAQYYAFEMEQGGSKSAPKGLPLPSQQIRFTVFVSLKAGKKAGLEQAPADTKWLIQGELALDVPVSECPGEMGVVAFQIGDIPKKSDLEAESESSVESTETQKLVLEQKNVAQSEVAATASVKRREVHVKEAVTAVIPLLSIKVPGVFLNTQLNPFKTAAVREYATLHNKLDKPITVREEEGEYWLVDGYRRYVVASEMGFEQVPVRIKAK